MAAAAAAARSAARPPAARRQADARRRQVVSGVRRSTTRATLRTVFLQFENADWEKELAAFNNTDVEVPATLTVDGKTYKDVGVHFRGASSFMMVPEGLKRSLNLSLDFVHEKQELGGYRTLNLLNANGDPDVPARGALLADRAAATSRRRRRTTCAW